MSTRPERPPTHYELVIISDIHLFARGAQAPTLCQFLHNSRIKKLVANGDGVDWQRWLIRNSKILRALQERPASKRKSARHLETSKMPDDHLSVVDMILYKSQEEGTEVSVVPGNHDIWLRQPELMEKEYFGIRLQEQVDYEMPNKERALILHGDIFDSGLRSLDIYPDSLKLIFDEAYTGVKSGLSNIDKAVIELTGTDPEIAAWFRDTIEKGFIDQANKDLKKNAIEKARASGHTAVFCGHTHSAKPPTEEDGVIYGNSGDWTESCTAITLNADGKWDLVNWRQMRRDMGLGSDFNAAAYPKYRKHRQQSLKLIAAAERAVIKNYQHQEPDFMHGLKQGMSRLAGLVRK